MSIERLSDRAQSAKLVTVAILDKHELKFHKVSKDGSGKCDAAETHQDDHSVIGVVFEISSELEEGKLDLKEGSGYKKKIVEVKPIKGGEPIKAIMYYAIDTDSTLKPYREYKEHVLRGAKENGLPDEYIKKIASIESV